MSQLPGVFVRGVSKMMAQHLQLLVIMQMLLQIGSTALGFQTVASTKQATAAGYKASASGEGATALGANAIASIKVQSRFLQVLIPQLQVELVLSLLVRM